MSTNLAASPVEEQPSSRFPYANWGPWLALGGIFIAIGTGVVLAIPAAIFGHKPNGDLTSTGNVLAQLASELGFLMVPMAIAAQCGAATLGEVLSRLGVRPVRLSALKWVPATYGIYLLCLIPYGLLVHVHQKDIVEDLGALPLQILVIVLAAPICEEVLFRGMLFGGLRERLPRIGAALVSGVVFGGLHATTGISAVPPLIIFGILLALLYERTGSILPGILVHMLNNGIVLLLAK
jgi:membrane protease YdiL (CAAX protease family)